MKRMDDKREALERIFSIETPSVILTETVQYTHLLPVINFSWPKFASESFDVDFTSHYVGN